MNKKELKPYEVIVENFKEFFQKNGNESCKEKYTIAPYWKLKLLQSNITKNIKVFMITSDRNNELSFKTNIHKSRIVMAQELDGIYIAKSTLDTNKKIKGLKNLLQDLEKLLLIN